MPKSTRLFIWSPSRKSPSRSSRRRSLDKFQSYRNVQSTKSTFSQHCSHAPTSSSTSICSKQLTTFTLSMSSATEVPWTSSCKKKVLSLKRSHSCISGRSSRLLKYCHEITLCTGISNLIIFSFTREISKLQILGSANLFRIPTNLPKRCWDPLSTWLLRL